MTAPPTVVAWRSRLAALARGNLGAMLADNVVLMAMNMAILVMINRVYARPGDTTDAGRLAVIISVMLGAVLLTSGGVSRAVVLRLSRVRAAGGEGAGDEIARTIGGGVVLAVVLSAALTVLGLAAPWLVHRIVQAGWPEHAAGVASYVGPFQWAALWVPSYSLLLVMVAVYDGFQQMRWSLWAEAGTFQLLRFVVAAWAMLAAGLAWGGLVAAWAVAFAAGLVLVALELAWFLRRQRQRVAWTGLPLKGMLRDAGYLFLPWMAPMLVSQAGVLMAWAGGGAEASAAFWVAWTVAIGAMELCLPVGRVLFPAVAALARQADPQALRRALRLSFWGTSAVMLTAFFAVTALKGWVLAYLNQPGQATVLTVLMAAGFFEVHRTVFNPVLLATGYERILTLLEWLVLVTILVAGGGAMAAWGLYGLAGVFLVVYVVAAMLRVHLVARATGVRMWPDVLATAVVVLGVAGAVVAYEASVR